MDIIRTNIIKLLSLFVKKNTFNKMFRYNSINLKKHLFTLLFAVISLLLKFFQTIYFLFDLKNQHKRLITKKTKINEFKIYLS